MASPVWPSGAAPLAPRQSTTPRIRVQRQKTWRELPRRLGVHARRARFSLSKLRQLLTYARTTSAWRQVAVIVLFPVPSVLASFIPPLIPLEDPSRGFHENPTFLLLLFVASMLTVSGTIPQIRAAAAISHTLYTNTDIVLVGLASSAPLLGLATLAATYWQFPIPFFWVLGAGPWLLCVIFGHAVVFSTRLHCVAPPLLAYMPSLAVQVAQIIIYPAYSALFEAAGYNAQIALILLFPLLKAAIKKSIYWLTRRSNRELSSEISVSAVEVCSAMYQANIMQTTPSFLASALLIGIDVLQGAIAIHRFMRHGSALQRAEVMATMARLADEARQPIVADDRDLSNFGTRRAAILPVPKLPGSSTRTIAVASVTESYQQKRSLTQALELLQTAETILLVEYLEVAVPLVNALYLAFATQFASAIYNPRLRGFYHNPDELGAALVSVVVYTSLQALTLMAMAAALQHRLKLSALTLMAFVLENHAWSLQGKLIPWLSVFLVFPIVHFGVDFTFKFDFATPPTG